MTLGSDARGQEAGSLLVTGRVTALPGSQLSGPDGESVDHLVMGLLVAIGVRVR